jgi:hypothetical protein
MATQYKCQRCWKTAGMPGRCCGVPVARVSLDEGIVWPLMWLPPQGERGVSRALAVTDSLPLRQLPDRTHGKHN